MLIVLLDAREINLIPLGLQTFLLNSRVPVEELAILASWDDYWFSVFDLLIDYNMLYLDSHLLIYLKAHEHFATWHIVH